MDGKFPDVGDSRYWAGGSGKWVVPGFFQRPGQHTRRSGAVWIWWSHDFGLRSVPVATSTQASTQRENRAAGHLLRPVAISRRRAPQGARVGFHFYLDSIVHKRQG